jgi:hypothetical protein
LQSVERLPSSTAHRYTRSLLRDTILGLNIQLVNFFEDDSLREPLACGILNIGEGATPCCRVTSPTSASATRQDLLSPVYGWFTEGFDTLDLKEAKALIDALAS